MAVATDHGDVWSCFMIKGGKRHNCFEVSATSVCHCVVSPGENPYLRQDSRHGYVRPGGGRF